MLPADLARGEQTTVLYMDEVDAYAAHRVQPLPGETKLIQAERGRAERGVDALLAPLLDERALLADAEAYAAQMRVQMITEGAMQQSMLPGDMYYSSTGRPGMNAQQGQPSYDAAAYGSFEDELRESRREAMRHRDREMAMLESRLAEVMQERGAPPARDEAAEAEAELPQEEAISSVVQHLSPFGLNRNLPWQIYATRPKRFTRQTQANEADSAFGSAMLAGGSYAADELGFLDGGDSAVPLRQHRAVLRSVYDKSARPARLSGARPKRMRANDYSGAFPPVRGAEGHSKGPPSDAWVTPRGSAPAAVQAARALSPRVLHPQGAYY